MFVTYFTYFIMRMAEPASTLLPLEQGHEKFDGVDGKMRSQALVYLYAMALLNSALAVQSFIKVMFFLRIQEGFGLLVDLVSECLVAAIPFTVFLGMWIGLFTVLYRLLGLEIAPDDYDQLGRMAIYSI